VSTPSSSPYEQPSRAEKLLAAAREAAEVRAYATDSDVVALRIERRRILYNVLIWASVVVGLSFTASNVQQFAAHGASPASLAWWFAWLLDPTITLALVAILVAEEVTSTWSVATPRAATRVKWVTLALTYVMNTWGAWSALNIRLIILHSAPVIGVFVVVGAAAKMRNAITEVVAVATRPVSQTGQDSSQDSPDSSSEQVTAELPDTLPAPDRTAEDTEVEEDRDMPVARTIARHWADKGDRVSRSKLVSGFRERGLTLGTERAARMAKALNDEVDAARPSLRAVGGSN
jgi:hypothetical protein